MSLFHLLHFKGFEYVGIYLSLALGILGLPIPDEALMTFVGYSIQEGKISYLPCLLISLAGSLTGMSLSYLIGKGILAKIEVKLESKYNLKAKKEKFENLFNRYGNFIIVIGYFFPGIRHINAYSSGLLKINYAKFLTYALIGAFLWINTFFLIGFYLGNDWRYILHFSIKYKKLIAVFAIIIVSIFTFFYFKKDK